MLICIMYYSYNIDTCRFLCNLSTLIYVYTCTDHPVSSPLGLQGKIASKKIKEVSL